MSGKTCYMCDKIATSREHVPPSALFPEWKDLKRNLRRDLITVPSCEEHNSRKSKDDEFLLFAFLIHRAKNDVGDQQFMTKLLRAAKRRPHVYRNFVKFDAPVVTVEGGPLGQAIQIDHDRFDRSIRNISRALFFHHFETKFELSHISVLCPNFLLIDGPNVSPDVRTLQLTGALQKFMENLPYSGSNPEAFRYRIRYLPESKTFGLEMIFYDAVIVCTYASEATQIKLAAAG